MIVTTDKTEVGIVVRENGRYELALYNRKENRLIRFPIDPVLAWAISGTPDAPITADQTLNARIVGTPDLDS